MRRLTGAVYPNGEIPMLRVPQFGWGALLLRPMSICSRMLLAELMARCLGLRDLS